MLNELSVSLFILAKISSVVIAFQWARRRIRRDMGEVWALVPIMILGASLVTHALGRILS